MKIETDEGFISLVARNDAEAALLEPIMIAINADDPSAPACLNDNLENGPERRIINGVLNIQVSA